MSNIAASPSPLYQLRVSLSRVLIEFQNDLDALEKGGLQRIECTDVKEFLSQAVKAFKQHATGPTCVYELLAHHFEKYSIAYAKWNGHEGDDHGKPEARRKEVAAIVEQRRKLFRKLSTRQAELASSPQLDLPLVNSVRLPFANLAAKHPERFPHLRQASVLFGI